MTLFGLLPVYIFTLWVQTVLSDDTLRYVSHATNDPGLSLTISQSGLNYAASVAADLLAKDIKGKPVPDQHGKAHEHGGKVDYDITGMRITGFTKPGFTLTVVPGHGLTVSLTNAGVSLHGNWHYKFRYHFVKLSDHGSFDVTVTGASINTQVAMGKSADGHPTISMTSCSSNIGKVKVKFHGGASWLYNLFSHNIEKVISKNIQDMLCSSAKKALNEDANKALARMKIKVPVHKTPLIIDYRLVTPPVFGKGFLQSNHKGEFFWAADQTEAPFQPMKMELPKATQKMVTFCLSDYVMDTLGYVLNKNGLIKYTLTEKDLKGDEKGFLNTTCSKGPKCIGSIIPPLGKKFPNSTVELSMATTSAPTIHSASGDVSGKFNGSVTFNVRLPNGTVTLGFSTKTVANVSLTGHVSLNDSNRITAKVNHLAFHMTVTKSNVGDITDTFLNTIFGFAVKIFIIPQMNTLLAGGFELPTVDVVQFVNPQVYMLQNTVCFGTDAKYTPK